MSPVVASKLYKDVCLPKLCYGSEVLTLGKESMNAMETLNFQSSKIMQGLPKNTSDIGSIMSIGWNTIQATVDIARIMFVYRVLSLPVNNIYKVVMLRRIVECLNNCNCSGPTQNMIDTCRKYNVLDYIAAAVDYGIQMTMYEWKKLVKGIVLEMDQRRCIISSKMYKSVSMFYMSDAKYCMLQWWHLAYKYPRATHDCRLLVKLIFNVYRLGKNICRECHLYKEDSIDHILFECICNKELREVRWLNVESSCPPQLKRELNRMPIKQRTRFILNAFQCKFVNEWMPMYIAVCSFVSAVYNEYYIKSKV